MDSSKEKLADKTLDKSVSLDQSELLHRLDNTSDMSPNMKILYIAGVVVIILGLGTGLFLAKNNLSSKTGSLGAGNSNQLSLGGKKVFGSNDTSTFKDMAEGKLDKGGINGEGTHRLIRPGGDSQTVYLTSTVLDLNQFVGKKIRVWGQTFAAKKAGWLMDVGKLEIID